ncbi:MAG: hypothetical protein JM58_05640 [Peptococcaceae bacterium BICA1-8]|nr:MAG: hypothetical protein JM58_05640 [Peptococcaceae bacterium BICA1-8]
MSARKMTVDEKFYRELSEYMPKGEEISVKNIYSLFPEKNPKTLSWRLHRLVQQGKLYKTGHGYYALTTLDKHNASGYDYLQKKSQIVHEIAIDYGYNFYITGLDSLIGEILHIPEKYPVLLVIENEGIKEIQEVLNEKGFIVLTEKERKIIEKTTIKNKIDIIILKGKDFSLSDEHIAQKEKGFVDLYYAVTRMDYGISIPELSRIYQSMQRNNSIAITKLKNAARDRGISTEINWPIELNKTSKKVLEFMSYQIKEVK